MDKPQDPEAAETVQTTEAPAVDLPRLVLPIGRKLRHAFNVVLSEAENARCENLHHAKKHRHESGEMCPVEYHIQRQAFLVREFLKQNRKINEPGCVIDPD